MKKILSKFLVITMILSNISFVSALAKSELDFSEGKAALDKFKIVEVDETTQDNDVVTRAEFADYVSRALRLEENNDITYFVDIPKTHWAAGKINALVDVGVISEAPDKKFNPDVPITYEQACKILVCAVGFKPFTDSNNIMQTYVLTATEAGIDVEVENLNEIKFNEAVEMIYKAMMTAMPVMTGTTAGGYMVEVSDEDNLFSKYYDVYKNEGYVLGYYGQSMTDQTYRKNEVCIDGEIYYTDEGFSPDGLLGKKVEFLYKEDDDEFTIFYAEIEDEEKIETVSSNLISDFDENTNTVAYYKNEASTKISKLDFSENAKISYNGKIYKGKISDIFNEFLTGNKKGTIEFIKTQGNDYDTLVVSSYKAFVAGSYDSNNETLYSKYAMGEKIDFSAYKEIIIKNKFNEETTLPTVFPAPLLVAESYDKSTLTVICNMTTETINVTGITQSAGGKSVLVTDTGEEKVFDQSVYEFEKNNVSAGGTYEVVIDIFNEIIAAESTSAEEDMIIAYLRGIQLDEEYNINLDTYEKDALFHRYKLAQKVRIDGASYKVSDYKKVLEAIPGDITLNDETGKVLVKRQAIRYKLNTNNEIIEIDTYNVGSNEDAETTLRNITGGMQEWIYSSGRSGFGMSVVYNSGVTNCFIVPSVNNNNEPVIAGMQRGDEESLYSVKYTPRDWYKYHVDAYKYKNDTLYADIIVLYEGELDRPNYYTMMFKKLSKKVDTDGEIVNVITGYVSGQDKEYILSDSALEEAKKLNQGDIFCANAHDLHLTGQTIYKVTKMYDVKTKTFCNSTLDNYNLTNPNRPWFGGGNDNTEYTDANANTWRGPNYQIVKGYAYDVKGTAIGLSYELADANADIMNAVFDVSGKVCSIFDSDDEREPLKKGSVSDITTYKQAGSDCDMILITSKNSGIYDVFIVK